MDRQIRLGSRGGLGGLGKRGVMGGVGGHVGMSTCRLTGVFAS